MEIIINSKPFEVPEGTTVADALATAGCDGKGVATAVNGEVVPAGNRAEVILKEGDTILLIKAFYGG